MKHILRIIALLGFGFFVIQSNAVADKEKEKPKTHEHREVTMEDIDGLTTRVETLEKQMTLVMWVGGITGTIVLVVFGAFVNRLFKSN
jgi:hypothetical protein